MSSTVLSLLKHKGTPIFRRNPRVFPPAKSKLLRIKQPHIPDPVEYELLNQWWPEYKRQTAAIQDVLKHCFLVNEEESSTRREVREEAFDDELIAINDKWNAEAKLARENFYLKDFNEKITETLIRRKEYDQMELERIEKLKKKLFLMKEYDKTMVTRENIDSRVDEIMSSEPVNYNHAVNERGKAVFSESKVEPSSHQPT
nr:mitochondrial ribosomal protein S26 [Hymenolepis microstoma]